MGAKDLQGTWKSDMKRTSGGDVLVSGVALTICLMNIIIMIIIVITMSWCEPGFHICRHPNPSELYRTRDFDSFSDLGFRNFESDY